MGRRASQQNVSPFTAPRQYLPAVRFRSLGFARYYVRVNSLLVARQWENLPVNFPKPSPVDAGIYRDYVGQHRWRPHGDVDIVSVKDGKLWSRMGKGEDEYLPLGSETFSSALILEASRSCGMRGAK
jgi:hypothetical protein